MEWGATQLVTKKLEISEFTYGPFVVWLWQLSVDVAKDMVAEEEEEVLAAVEVEEEYIIIVDRTGSRMKIIPKWTR